ncbi:ribonuclease HII [Anianabacter salinae]|uniref:ribonuclease HII n=1 Tax=Anianabacter salinae TaxID=2851023 RepID=UPI00225DE3D7|nr:ribonuclease HII [Anianabacter salinae]MBV0913639.1 ribonuclease HII [Anianabacter salinae]
MEEVPDFTHETRLIASGLGRIAGVDEAGRGPLAGPVVAAAVVLDPAAIPDGLNDSKKLTALRREALFDLLPACADVGVGIVEPAEIDEINILNASLLAMCRALEALATPVDHALIDGNRLPPGLTCAGTAIVKGDALCLSIAAASVVAKVTRDRIMVDLAQQHPGYGWERNAGYPTKDHIAALAALGVTPCHRRSFRPVHNILYQEHSPSD